MRYRQVSKVRAWAKVSVHPYFLSFSSQKHPKVGSRVSQNGHGGGASTTDGENYETRQLWGVSRRRIKADGRRSRRNVGHGITLTRHTSLIMVFTLVITAIPSKAGILCVEGTEKLSFEGNCTQSVIPEGKLLATLDSLKEEWQPGINEHVVYFTDGSMSKIGKVGAGWNTAYGVGQGCKAMFTAATVWDGEIGGLKGALQTAPKDQEILLLSDSQAGRKGRARPKDIQMVVENIGKRQQELSPDAVQLGLVEAHVSLYGNEQADRLAKRGDGSGGPKETTSH